MVSTWMGDHTDHSGVEVDAVVKNTVKFQEWRNGPPIKTSEAKKQNKKQIQTLSAPG